MSETKQGHRVEWPEGLLNNGEYAKHPLDGNWYAMTPNGHLAGLARHAVVEHEDGSITVNPSILVLGMPDAPGEHRSQRERELWHGYLERGVWRQC